MFYTAPRKFCTVLLFAEKTLEKSGEKCYNELCHSKRHFQPFATEVFKIKGELTDLEKAKRVFIVLAVIALLICCGFLNVLGGIGLYSNGYEEEGAALFISSFSLALSVIFLGRDRVVLPAVFDIIGTAGYVYAAWSILQIPHSKVPKQSTEMFAGRIYPAAIVTALVLIVIIMNRFSPKQKQKRGDRRRKKYDKTKRALRKDEKIL